MKKDHQEGCGGKGKAATPSRPAPAPSLCQVCGEELDDGRPLVECSACGSVHHEACWDYNRGCSTYGCGSRSCRARAVLRLPEVPAVVPDDPEEEFSFIAMSPDLVDTSHDQFSIGHVLCSFFMIVFLVMVLATSELGWIPGLITGLILGLPFFLVPFNSYRLKRACHQYVVLPGKGSIGCWLWQFGRKEQGDEGWLRFDKIEQVRLVGEHRMQIALKDGRYLDLGYVSHHAPTDLNPFEPSRDHMSDPVQVLSVAERLAALADCTVRSLDVAPEEALRPEQLLAEGRRPHFPAGTTTSYLVERTGTPSASKDGPDDEDDEDPPEVVVRFRPRKKD